MSERRSRGPIDWADLRSRMEAAGRAIGAGGALGPEHAAAVLEARARALARPPDESLPGGTVELVTFAAGGARYGVDPLRVLEICRAGHVVPLPGAEPWVAGLAVWRGDLVQVVDLGVLLGGTPMPPSDRRTMVVLGADRASLALLAGGPGALEMVATQDLRPPPEEGGGREYIRAVSAAAVLVLDLDRVLSLVGRQPV
jgi:purine-binding chemotaxis protein CheW